MEENKTIFNYMSQLFTSFGIIVAIFMAFTYFIGDYAKDISSLYSLGAQGLSVKTLGQIFILSLVITIAQNLFLTDRWIKSMNMVIRNITFFAIICLTIVCFSWFPIENIYAWTGFLICFSICSVLSVVIKKLAENAENKKLEQALLKLKESK